MATYRDYFYKYGGDIEAVLLARIMLSICEQLGNKFVFSRVDPSKNMNHMKKALTMLSLERVCIKILHTTGTVFH